MTTTQTGPQGLDPDDLYTVSAGGFSATADAFARDPDDKELWFLSMVGSQTALKAIWASLLKQPPEPAHLIRGVDGGELTGDYLRCSVPYRTIGTWTTKIARLPTTGAGTPWSTPGWRSSPSSGRTSSCWPAPRRRLPALHHRFLDRRSPLPLHDSWAGWLWRRGLRNGEIKPLQASGISAWVCSPDAEKLRADLSDAVALGTLVLAREAASSGGAAS